MDAPRKRLRPDREAVRAAREDAELTKYGLAKVLGCSRSTITDIEGGRRNTTRPLLTAIANACGVEVETLVAADEPRRQTTPQAAVDLQQVRDEERAVSEDLPELREDVTGGAR